MRNSQSNIMTTVKARINTVILACGITILVLAIFMVAAGFLIDKFLKEDGRQDYLEKMSSSSQYWAGIPVSITAVVIIIGIYKNNQAPAWLKILLMICILVSMFLTLAVIIEEGRNASVMQINRKYECDKNIDDKFFYHDRDCQKSRGIEALYQILLLFSDMTFVLCLVALMAMFADWILSVEQKHAGNYVDAEHGYERAPPTYESSIVNSAIQPRYTSAVQQMPRSREASIPLRQM